MAQVTLKISVSERDVVKTMQFESRTTVYDACTMIRQKMPEASNLGNPKDYGLFLTDGDPKRGVWMENGKSLEYYLVRNGDTLEYKRKTRQLKVRTLDGAVKPMVVDESQAVGQLMVVICTKLGITNHEEYSLTRDFQTRTWDSKSSLRSREESKSSLIGSLTRGRSKEKRMEQMRKQMQEEEANWLDHSRTLREQGISESDVVLLRRKFFFSDQSIDSRDPVQLNLLYIQCRNGVMDGTHPVSREEAFGLAGLQCQIQFGDFAETKHRGGFLDAHEFLPKEYVKTKDAEKRILMEYRQCRGTSEADAKMEYIRRCRGLKTYGVTFFLVKEKMRGKNKLVTRLLGVNKDCVMRVDEKTKDVIKVYPLEQVRRWAASPNTFTLDFGDYQDQYYSVQTAEGEKIAQLIGGYIDIILRRKRAKDHFGIEGDEGSTMLEDIVAPAKATLMSHGAITADHPEEGSVALPAILRPGAEAEMPHYGSLTRAQYGAVGGTWMMASAQEAPAGQQAKIVDTGAGRAQRALLGTIETSIKQVERAKDDLGEKATLPPLGDDDASRRWREKEMTVHKQTVTDHLAAVGAATAQVVQLTGGETERVDHTAVGAAVSTIGSNVPDVTRGVRTVAALMEDEERGDELLEATRLLCGSITELLTCVSPEHEEPRTKVLSSAGQVGDYSHTVIRTMGQQLDYEKEFQDLLLELAKRVATATAQLVLRAKTVSGTCQDAELRDRIIHSATQCAFTTSQLVACARVVAPTIDSPACREQLVDACRQVIVAVEQLLKDAEMCKDDAAAVGDLREAAKLVIRAVEDLLAHLKAGPKKTVQEEHVVESAMTSADRLVTESGPANEMIRQARVLAEATTHLVTHLRGEADVVEDDAERQRRMREAAQRLADATARMVEAARSCATSPDDASLQLGLKSAAEELRVAMTSSTRDQIRRKALLRLEEAAKRAVAAAGQNISAARASESTNTNMQSVQDLNKQCREVADILPRIITSVKRSQAQTDSQLAQFDLITVCEELLQPGGRLVNSGRLAAPTVREQSSSIQLTNTASILAETLAELRVAITRARDACGPLDLDTAIEIVRGLDSELIEYRHSYIEKRLHPWPGESPENSASKLITSTKSIGSSVAQLVSAAAQADEHLVGVSCRDTVDGLRNLTHGIHGVSATRPDADGERLITSGRTVMRESIHLFEEIKTCLRNPNRPENQLRLAEAARLISSSLTNCVSCLPGQEDVDSTLRAISNLLSRININQIPISNRTPKEALDELLLAAKLLMEATHRLVSTVGGPSNLISEAAHYYVKCLERFVSAGLEVAYHQQDPVIREQIIEALKTVVQESMRLLASVKSSTTDPTSPTAKQQLGFSSRSVIESINRLIDICTGGAPWQKECDNALRSIQAMYPLYENPVEPVNEFTYYECLDVVVEKPRNLGEGMAGIAQHAKTGEMDLFCHSIREVANAVCGLAEAGAQAAYLVGAADASSIPGTQSLVDTNKMAQSVGSVREACDRISSGRVTQPEVLQAATTIAKHTGTLANICRDASSRTQNPNAKKQFINCAREVASSTAELIKAIKDLDTDFNETNKRSCAVATQPLISALDNLSTFAASPEFAGVRAQISQRGREAQNPIITAGRGVLDGACNMIKAAKALAAHPKEPSSWEQLAEHTKSVSDSVRHLVRAIRDNAPGQKECDGAIEKMKQMVRLLDQTELAAISQTLPQRTSNTEQGFLEQADNSARQILDRVEGLRVASKREAENLGHRINEIMAYYDPLADGIIGAASLITNSRRQMALLNQCKSTAECQLQLLYAAKDAAGNPKAVQYHKYVDEQCDNLRQALSELLQTVGEAIVESGIMSTMIDGIGKAIARTDETARAEGSFADYLSRMIKCCKEIDRLAKEMSSKAYSNVEELGPLALELSRNYAMLADDTPGAVATASTPEIGQRIRSAVQQLGAACIDLVKNSGACRASPVDHLAKRDVSDSSRIVSEKVALVLAALEAGARGLAAAAKAACTVSGIIGDLDTTIMFATAGTLVTEREAEAFSIYREAISKAAKALVEDTKALVSGAASNQEQLAVSSQNVVRTIVSLADAVKAGAASLTPENSEAQVLLIYAVKHVAVALRNLITATCNAYGHSLSDPAMALLKDAAKVMVSSIASLANTMRGLEGGQQRGALAVQAALESIAHELRVYESAERPSYKGDPNELTRATRAVMEATERAVSAGQTGSQDEALAAANFVRKVISDLLINCKAVAYSADNFDNRYRCLDGGREVAVKVATLLQALHMTLVKPSSESRQSLVSASRVIALAVTDLVAIVETLKTSDWAEAAGTVSAVEDELVTAANAIDTIARKVTALKPRPQSRDAETGKYFDEELLEAALATSHAAAALVRAAIAAQREWMDQRKSESLLRRQTEDSQWLEGLVSAARMLVSAIGGLYDATNALIQGYATEEKLSAAAKQVASSAAHLLVACKVKADASSKSMQRLQASGNAVKVGTEHYILAAKRAVGAEDERTLTISQRLVSGIALVLSAQDDVVKRERDLEEARARLAAIRRSQRDAPGSRERSVDAVHYSVF